MKTMLSFPLLAGMLAAFILLYPAAASAQYFMETGPGYTLGEVSEDDTLLLASPHPLVLAAQDATSMELDAIFRLHPGMRRYFTKEWTEDGVEYMAEYEIVPPEGWQAPATEEIDYNIRGLEIIIGMGYDFTDSPDWPLYAVVSLLEYPDGSLEELDRYALGAQFCPGVFALDMTADGIIELVIPWATGAGGGGGVEVLAVVPTGGLATFGDPELATIYSQNGYCELLDYDGDGGWELETAFPLLFTAAGYSYKDLLVFDREEFAWVSGEPQFPEYYATQDRFYHALIEQARLFMEEPEQFRVDSEHVYGDYACRIDGELYSLDPFVDFSSGEPDPYWLEVLEEMFPAETSDGAESSAGAKGSGNDETDTQPTGAGTV